MRRTPVVFVFALAATALLGLGVAGNTALPSPAPPKAGDPVGPLAAHGQGAVEQSALGAIARGRQTFRFDTFGDEAFWGGTLRLHEAIAGAANGGVGGGLSPRAALGLGLKVDAD